MSVLTAWFLAELTAVLAGISFHYGEKFLTVYFAINAIYGFMRAVAREQR